MAKGPSPSDATPDLFSRAARPDELPLLGNSKPTAPQLPHLLPKDLPSALHRLTDDELKKLFDASGDEMRRRNLMPELAPAASRTPVSMKSEHRTSATARASKTSGPLPITQSKLNAIRAALKAGVKPNTIARQFGVTPAMIKKALESL